MFTVEHIHINYDVCYNTINNICPICHNDLLDKCIECFNQLPSTNIECKAIQGICNHGYHFHCINKWLKTRRTCPLDNTKWVIKKIN